MCKSWSIRYTCTHTRTVRRSPCRGTFSGPSLRTGEIKVRCSGSDPLKLASSSLCVSCRRAQVESELQDEVRSLRSRHEADLTNQGIAAELAIAESELADKLWTLTKELPPDGPSKEFIRPVRSRIPPPVCMGSSLLRHEVQRENVVDAEQCDQGWVSEWASGWSYTTEVNETEQGGPDEVGLTWPDDDVIESIDWTLDETIRETSPKLEQDLDVKLADLNIQPSSDNRSKPANAAENIKPRELVIPPHRRRRGGSTIRGRAQQAIEDLRSMHACGGYRLGRAVSN